MSFDSDIFPSDFDPLGDNEVEVDDEEYETLFRLGLKKVCAKCEVFMDTIEGTEAEVFRNKTLDNVHVRTWAICPECGDFRLIP